MIKIFKLNLKKMKHQFIEFKPDIKNQIIKGLLYK